jgi:hypothetical protein
MTTTAGAGRVAQGADTLGDLRRFLPPTAFPARRDELLATLVRRHAPTPYLWEVSRLSANRVYAGIDEVVAGCSDPGAAEVREPW